MASRPNDYRRISCNLSWTGDYHIMSKQPEFVTRPLVSDIITKASMLSGMTVKEIRTPSRRRDACHIRSAIIWVARHYIVKEGAQDRFSYPNLAKMLNRDNHTTVRHAHLMFDKYCQTNPELLPFAQKLKRFAEQDYSSLHDELANMRTELERIERSREIAEAERIKALAERKAREAYEATLKAEQREAARRARIAKSQAEREKAKQEHRRIVREKRLRDRRAMMPEQTGKDKNNFLPEEDDEIDGSHEMMLDMAEGSRKLLNAIIREHRNVYNPSKSPSNAKNLIG